VLIVLSSTGSKLPRRLLTLGPLDPEDESTRILRKFGNYLPKKVSISQLDSCENFKFHLVPARLLFNTNTISHDEVGRNMRGEQADLN
jgi:hypothetical protein